MLSAYLGTDNGMQIRDYIIHHSLAGFFSIRKGKWKLTTNLGSGGFTQPVNDDPKEGIKQEHFIIFKMILMNKIICTMSIQMLLRN
jgi:hypothetical protein